MPIFRTEAALVTGQELPHTGKLQELNDASTGAYLSLVTDQNGRVVVNVEPSSIDTATLHFSLPSNAVLDGFVQTEENGRLDATPIMNGSEFGLGATALAGLFMPSSMYFSNYVPNIDASGRFTGERTYVYRLTGFLFRTRTDEDIVVPWETDEIFL